MSKIRTAAYLMTIVLLLFSTERTTERCRKGMSSLFGQNILGKNNEGKALGSG